MAQKSKGRIQSETEAFYVEIENAAGARASCDSWTDDYLSCTCTEKCYGYFQIYLIFSS